MVKKILISFTVWFLLLLTNTAAVAAEEHTVELEKLSSESWIERLYFKVTNSSVSLKTYELFEVLRGSVTADMRKNKQVVCMAKNIWYESRGESWDGKLAVAKVTQNRAENKNWPDDVCKVVYQKYENSCQFSWVCDNTISKPAGAEWREVLDFAATTVFYKDYYRDVSKGALYFHNNTVAVIPRKNKKITARIDNHIFYTYKPR